MTKTNTATRNPASSATSSGLSREETWLAYAAIFTVAAAIALTIGGIFTG